MSSTSDPTAKSDHIIRAIRDHYYMKEYQQFKDWTFLDGDIYICPEDSNYRIHWDDLQNRLVTMSHGRMCAEATTFTCIFAGEAVMWIHIEGIHISRQMYNKLMDTNPGGLVASRDQFYQVNRANPMIFNDRWEPLTYPTWKFFWGKFVSLNWSNSQPHSNDNP